MCNVSFLNDTRVLYRFLLEKASTYPMSSHFCKVFYLSVRREKKTFIPAYKTPTSTIFLVGIPRWSDVHPCRNFVSPKFTLDACSFSFSLYISLFYSFFYLSSVMSIALSPLSPHFSLAFLPPSAETASSSRVAAPGSIFNATQLIHDPLTRTEMVPPSIVYLRCWSLSSLSLPPCVFSLLPSSSFQSLIFPFFVQSLIFPFSFSLPPPFFLFISHPHPSSSLLPLSPFSPLSSFPPLPHLFYPSLLLPLSFHLSPFLPSHISIPLPLFFSISLPRPLSIYLATLSLPSLLSLFLSLSLPRSFYPSLLPPLPSLLSPFTHPHPFPLTSLHCCHIEIIFYHSFRTDW